jgi:hypothetical protein
MKKETVNAIGDHFLEKNVGWFNEWHFLKAMNKLPAKYKNSWEERTAPPVRRIDQFCFFFLPWHKSDISAMFANALIVLQRPFYSVIARP